MNASLRTYLIVLGVWTTGLAVLALIIARALARSNAEYVIAVGFGDTYVPLTVPFAVVLLAALIFVPPAMFVAALRLLRRSTRSAGS